MSIPVELPRAEVVQCAVVVQRPFFLVRQKVVFHRLLNRLPPALRETPSHCRVRSVDIGRRRDRTDSRRQQVDVNPVQRRLHASLLDLLLPFRVRRRALLMLFAQEAGGFAAVSAIAHDPIPPDEIAPAPADTP